MNETKYIQLQSNTTALQTKINAYQTQIEGVAVKLASLAISFPVTVSELRKTLDPLSTAAPPLGLAQTEQLHGAQRVLEQHKKNLQKEFQKPLLQYQKILLKSRTECTALLHHINAAPKDCKFDLKSLRALLDSNATIITKGELKVLDCSRKLSDLQTLISGLEDHIKRIDLPHELLQTTKQVEKLAESLAGLKMQMIEAPTKCSEYGKDFLFLGRALQTLHDRSTGFSAELDTLAQTPKATSAPAPAPSV